MWWRFSPCLRTWSAERSERREAPPSHRKAPPDLAAHAAKPVIERHGTPPNDTETPPLTWPFRKTAGEKGHVDGFKSHRYRSHPPDLRKRDQGGVLRVACAARFAAQNSRRCHSFRQLPCTQGKLKHPSAGPPHTGPGTGIRERHGRRARHASFRTALLPGRTYRKPHRGYLIDYQLTHGAIPRPGWGNDNPTVRLRFDNRRITGRPLGLRRTPLRLSGRSAAPPSSRTQCGTRRQVSGIAQPLAAPAERFRQYLDQPRAAIRRHGAARPDQGGRRHRPRPRPSKDHPPEPPPAPPSPGDGSRRHSTETEPAHRSMQDQLRHREFIIQIFMNSIWKMPVSESLPITLPAFTYTQRARQR